MTNNMNIKLVIDNEIFEEIYISEEYNNRKDVMKRAIERICKLAIYDIDNKHENTL